MTPKTAWENAEKIAADTTRTRQYKQQQIGELFSAAIAETRENLADRQTRLTKDIEKLRLAFRQSIVPSADQVALLQYTHEALESRWRWMGLVEMFADWNAALSGQDLITARVYRDFAATHLGTKADPTARRSGRKPLLPREFNDLATRTDEALSTPDQRKARMKLADADATLLAVRRAANQSIAMLENVRIGTDGTLVDGIRAAQRERIRASF